MDALRTASTRRLPIGAEPAGDGAWLRVWAPDHGRVGVESCVSGRVTPLQPEADGYFGGWLPGATAGTRYWLRLGDERLPDPASRFQPEGPQGPSEIVDPGAFRWTDAGWPGLARDGQVLYELHVGTFTPEGTWGAARRELPRLAALGITAIELMPVAEFSGGFGWGYDGVFHYAPSHLYGSPDELRAFVDAAHGCGIGVLLDVVYNHFGPRGNVLPRFAADYVGARPSEWGEGPNFDGPRAREVRAYFAGNAAYWIDEFHLDGLRLDATQQIFDESPDHIIGEIVRRARAATSRRVLVIGENEPQEVRALQAPPAGYGCDALWNDDFHHSARVALTGHCEAYYSDYRGRPQEFVSCARRGFLFQGQRYHWQQQRRGTPTRGLAPSRFVHFLENHDQVANSLTGARLAATAAPARLRAMTALLLLGPQTPLLFQGQEYGSTRPFTYFADHGAELARQVREGRAQFMSQFPSIAAALAGEAAVRPEDAQAYAACKLQPGDRETLVARQWLALHQDLLALRRAEPLLQRPRAARIDGAVLGEAAFVLRYCGRRGADRLLVVNLGPDLELRPAPEPLLAPPAGRRWRQLWSSEAPRYGGGGAPPMDEEQGWRLAGCSAAWFRSEEH